MARLTILIICVAFLYVSNNVDSQGIGAKIETTLSKQIENKLENTTSFKYLTKTVVDEKKDDKKDDKNNSKNLTKTIVDEKKDNKNKELTKTVLDAPKNLIKEESKSRVARQANLPAIKTITIAYQLGKRVNGE